MGKLKRMDQVRLIIETYLQTQSIKATARRLKVARNTVKSYPKASGVLQQGSERGS